ncbi:hypothetical protein A8W25_01290 [Streptomyces sp. ERV7]|uniref:condensation domain-containing protein n=1 Tax=Streptomyces sp. ERV7 TaxID=1322334 RepID=UPI0007F419A7|nr:condensation domain-containing protein [Streptomyces sp. ERV7]OAR26952.1 hypothetical protein A8W25_01290 [Streptomyces sp. ERV7]
MTLDARPASAGLDQAPLSFQQEEMLRNIDRYPAVAAKYDDVFVFRLGGDVDLGCLAAAVAGLAERHGVLRSTIAYHGQEGQQVVQQPGVISLSETEHAHSSLDDVIRELLDNRYATVAALEGRPLFRPRLHRLDSTLLFSVTIHHLVHDGWSIVLLWRDLSELYAARLGRRAADLPALSFDYAEFARQQHAAWPEAAARQIPHWRELLADCTGEVAWPLPQNPPRNSPLEYERIPFTVDSTGLQALRRTAREERVSPFLVLLAATASAIARVTGQRDLVLGTDTASREDPLLQHLIGHLLNTRLTRVQPQAGQSLAELVQALREPWFAAARHADVYSDRVLQATGTTHFIPVQMPSLSPEWEAQYATGLTLVGSTVTPVPVTTKLQSWRSFAVLWLHDGAGFRATIYHRPTVVDHSTADAVRAEILALLQNPSAPR